MKRLRTLAMLLTLSLANIVNNVVIDLEGQYPTIQV